MATTATKPPSPLPIRRRLTTRVSSLFKWIRFVPGSYTRSHSTYSMARRRRMEVAAPVSFNPSGNFDLSLLDEEQGNTGKLVPILDYVDFQLGRIHHDLFIRFSECFPSYAPFRRDGRYEVVLDNNDILRLDLSPFQSATGITSASSVDPKIYLERTIGFTLNYEREDPRDPRELLEFPEIRLWFVRLDAAYPWVPVLLDWRAGELARYAAMLVPHQMNMKMGIVFNPEALELFVMNKVMVAYAWLKAKGVSKSRIKSRDMARMLGFGIGEELFDLIDKQPREGGSTATSQVGA